MYNTTPLELSSSFIVDIDNIPAIEGRGVSLEHKMNIPARYNSKYRNVLHRSIRSFNTLLPPQGASLPENFSVVHVRRVGILNLTWIGWEINLNRNCYAFSTGIHVVIVIVFRGKEFTFAALGWLRGAEIWMGICQGGGREMLKLRLNKSSTHKDSYLLLSC